MTDRTDKVHRTPGGPDRLVRPLQLEAITETVRRAAGSGMVVRGTGTSGRDTTRLGGGITLDLTGFNGILLISRRTGLAEVEAGVTLGALATVAEAGGWTLPIRPGSLRGTVGGAIATDAFGGNHVGAGSFGRHVEWIDVMNGEGEVERLTAETTPIRFWATIGGMGLTGIIVWAGLRLRPVGQTTPARNTEPAGDLEQILGRLSGIADRQKDDPDLDAAAWFHGSDPGPGRGLIETVRQAGGSEPAPKGEGVRRRMVRALHPAELAQSWPGLFGRGGLCRYHCVVPLGSEETLAQVLRLLQASRVRPALVTVRRLGDASPAPLSFARPGWSLALNFPYGRAGLPATLADLDTLVTRAGGRLDLTQDSWLDASGVAAMYPDLPDWRSARDAMDPGRVFVSDLGLRAGLVTL